MKVLLSIKPKYAQLIFDGSKKFEYRRSIFKNKEISTIVVYASYPIKKIIGEFEIDVILNNDLKDLWQETKEFAGINEDYFYQYFVDKSQGFAIKIKDVKKYKNPLCIKADFNLTPPQSFLYLKTA